MVKKYIMNVNFFKKWEESYSAVILTVVLIGLLFLLKSQEPKSITATKTTIADTMESITYVD